MQRRCLVICLELRSDTLGLFLSVDCTWDGFRVLFNWSTYFVAQSPFDQPKSNEKSQFHIIEWYENLSNFNAIEFSIGVNGTPHVQRASLCVARRAFRGPDRSVSLRCWRIKTARAALLHYHGFLALLCRGGAAPCRIKDNDANTPSGNPLVKRTRKRTHWLRSVSHAGRLYGGSSFDCGVSAIGLKN